MKKLPTTLSTPAITFALIGAMIGSVSAATIIEDTFSTTGTLSGSVADTGQVWSGSPWTVAGGEMTVTGNSTAATIGGLTLVPECQYVLSMDVSVTFGGVNWIGFGFTDTSGSNPASSSDGFMLHRQNPVVQLFSDGTGGVTQTVASPDPFPNTMEIILDTGVSLTTSTLSYRLNGVTIGVSAAADVSNVDGVFIQNISGSRGIVDNFTLTHDAVPEPSSAILLGFGALGFVARRKRQA